MTIPAPELKEWASFLANAGQFAFGLTALFLAVLAVTAKRKDLFTSELVKKQIEELGQVRSDLQAVFFNIYYLSFTKFLMEANEGWNTSNLREHAPDAWAQLEEYKNKSISLYYKFSSPDYYLFPSWIDVNKRIELSKKMEAFAPFTLMAATSKSHESVKTYMSDLIEMRDYIDAQLRKHV